MPKISSGTDSTPPTLSASRLSSTDVGSPARKLMSTRASTSSTEAAPKPSAVRVVRTLISSPEISRVIRAPAPDRS
jgi:hypothetical protein